MSKERRTSNYRLNYEGQREEIKMRENQRSHSTIRGNYRIDAEGNPIIKQTTNYLSHDELEQDYFTKKQHDVNQFEDQRDTLHNESQAVERTQAVYRFEDYYQGENETIDRMRQPNRRVYQAPQRHYTQLVQRQGHVRTPSTPPPISSNYHQSHHQTQNKNWYYKFHQRLNHQSQKASQAKLPKGRTALFAVFSMIYIIMIICGWQLMPFNRVNNLTVSGNELVPAHFIKYSSRILTYDKVDKVLEQREAIENVIKEENPMVESIAFTRPNWNALEITVSEHDIVGLINKDGYHPVLSNGTVIDASSNQELAKLANDSLPELIDFNTSGELTTIAEGLRQIDSEILASMQTITKVDDPNKPNAILVQMKDGNQIHAIISTFAQKVQYYPEILSQLEGAQGTINFEVGAYFTPNVANANSIKLDNN